MKNKICKLLPVSLLLTSLFALFGTSCFAFQEKEFVSSDSHYGCRYDDMSVIFGEQYDIVPAGRLVTDDMPGKIGAVSWQDYGLLTGNWGDYAFYLANNNKKPVYAVEFIVVKCAVDQVTGKNYTYQVVSDGNFYYPGKDIAVYFENGLRVLSQNGTLHFSFLENFVKAYCQTNSEYEANIHNRYQLYYVAYHSEITSDKPVVSITQEQYDALKEKYDEEKDARIAAEAQLEALNSSYIQLKAFNEHVSSMNKDLMEENKTLRTDLENALNEKEEAISDLITAENEYSSALARKEEEIKSQKDTIKGLETSLANNHAIAKFFTGIYEAVHQFVGDLFDLNVFGMNLGSVVCMLLIAVVVIFVIKLVF